MNLHWVYEYYQPWTDNEQLVKEIMVVANEVDKDNAMDSILAHQQQFGRDNYRY